MAVHALVAIAISLDCTDGSIRQTVSGLSSIGAIRLDHATTQTRWGLDCGDMLGMHGPPAGKNAAQDGPGVTGKGLV